MKTNVFSIAQVKIPRHAGVALVLTLSMIVLVTIAVVAFFAMTMANRRVEFSRASRTRADLLAQSGATHVSALVLAEITDANNSTTQTSSGVSIYEPKANSNAYPARFLSSAISVSDTSFFNLIRQSIPPTGSAPYPTYSEPSASAHSTWDPASNGHAVTTSRWNAPHLLVGNGFTSRNQVPNWVYVDRAKEETDTPTGDTIGRFAYNVYHTGGLLNINAVGLPAGVSSVANLIASLRGYQSGADLLQLGASPAPSPAPALIQSDLDALAAFRFPEGPSPSGYVNRMLAGLGNGLVTVQNTDRSSGSGVPFKTNMFASRKDLIRYANNKAPNLVPALPYLTHFSLASNGPSWKPAAGVTTNPDLANARFSAAGTITHYDDQGVAATYQVKAGDPLLQRRFSLAKLAWLSYQGPQNGISNAAIQAAFGVKWNSTEERWDYVGPTGTSMAGSIEDLSAVAGENREPNFFELLKAAIASNTLGGAPLAKTSPKTADPNTTEKAMSTCPLANNVFYNVPDLHVLQIGANIIDCADADNYPTRIAMQYGTLAIEKAGVEDLPYFYAMDMALFWQSHYDPAAPLPTSPYQVNAVHFTWVPELFCLHRPPAATNSLTPNIEVNILSGLLQAAGFAQNTSLTNLACTGPISKDLSALPVIPVAAADFEKFRNGPQPVRDPNAANRLGSTVPFVDSSIQDVLAFQLLDYADKTYFTKPFPFHISTSPNLPVIQEQQMIIALRYQTPVGKKMKTYSVLGGTEALKSTGIDGTYRNDFATPIFKQGESLDNLTPKIFNGPSPGTPVTIGKVNSCYLNPWDPRTSRFGPAYGSYEHGLAEIPKFSLKTGPDGSGRTNTDNAYAIQPFYPVSYFTWATDAWAGSVPQIPAFQDPDGMARQPDGYLGYNKTTAKTLSTNPANPYSDVTSPTYTPARPIVLQRPYRNVAELGYVFRDVPWQTLNLYNKDSGDGALLDVFSVADEPPVSASRIFLGMPQPVVTALFSGAQQEPDGSLPLSAANAAKLSADLQTYLFASGATTTTYPLTSADFATIMSESNIKTDAQTLGLSPIKSRREALSRAVAGVAQTRTWNLLVDVVAQTGRFPLKKTGATDFVVEGESHCWVWVAIDRYTGKIIGQQIEKIYE